MLYKQAETALDRYIYEGTGQLYAYTSLQINDKVDTLAGITIQPLVAAMKSGLFPDVEMQTELLVQSLIQRKPPISDLRSLLQEL